MTCTEFRRGSKKNSGCLNARGFAASSERGQIKFRGILFFERRENIDKSELVWGLGFASDELWITAFVKTE